MIRVKRVYRNFNKEFFDTTHQLRPYMLYNVSFNNMSLTSNNDNEITLSTTDLNNAKQWMLLDSDVGYFIFFNEMNAYPTIVDGNIGRSDQSKNKYGFDNFKLFIETSSNKYYFKVSDAENVMKLGLTTSQNDATVWTFKEVMDLRETANNQEIINDLKTMNDTNNSKIDALQKLIDKNEEIYNAELKYYKDKVQNVENNWLLNTLYKLMY